MCALPVRSTIGASTDRSGGRRTEIRVLGTVELVVDGQARSQPGAGERELLALLALSTDRVFAVPALVAAPWGEELPANPGDALQGRVSTLRRALAVAGLADVLLSCPPGYLLDVDPTPVGALRSLNSSRRPVPPRRPTLSKEPDAA